MSETRSVKENRYYKENSITNPKETDETFTT